MSELSAQLEKLIIRYCIQGNFKEVRAAEILPSMFTLQSAREIYLSIAKNYDDGIEIAWDTLFLDLRNSSQETRCLLSECDGSLPIGRNMVVTFEKFKNAYEHRVFRQQLREIMQKEMEVAEDAPCHKQELVLPVLKEGSKKSVTHRMHKGLNSEMMDYIENGITNGGAKIIPTGISFIDEITGGGFKAPNVVTIAARTGVGKTALATNIALNASLAGNHPLYITIELDEKELAQRLYCTNGKINTMAMSSFKLDEKLKDRLVQSAQALEGKKFSINASTGNSWESAEVSIINEVMFEGVDIVFIDYIQQFHLSIKSESFRQELVQITNRVKQLAMRLKIPIVMVAQLNREMDKRVDKSPILSDIKESSSIDQDSDIVFLLYRDKTTARTNGPNDGELWLKCEKHRGGNTCERKIEADLSINKIY